MPSGCRHPVTMTFRSEPSWFIERMRPPLRSRTNRRPTAALPLVAREVGFETVPLVMFSLVLVDSCRGCRGGAIAKNASVTSLWRRSRRLRKVFGEPLRSSLSRLVGTASGVDRIVAAVDLKKAFGLAGPGERVAD